MESERRETGRSSGTNRARLELFLVRSRVSLIPWLEVSLGRHQRSSHGLSCSCVVSRAPSRIFDLGNVRDTLVFAHVYWPDSNVLLGQISCILVFLQSITPGFSQRRDPIRLWCWVKGMVELKRNGSGLVIYNAVFFLIGRFCREFINFL